MLRKQPDEGNYQTNIFCIAPAIQVITCISFLLSFFSLDSVINLGHIDRPLDVKTIGRIFPLVSQTGNLVVVFFLSLLTNNSVQVTEKKVEIKVHGCLLVSYKPPTSNSAEKCTYFPNKEARK